MSTYYVAGIPYTDELYHHGIKGQKWGVRRFQNEDGSLTDAGKKRYWDAYEEAHDAFSRKYYTDSDASHRDPSSKTINKIESIRDAHASEQHYLNKQREYERLREERNKRGLLKSLFGDSKMDEAYKKAFKEANDAGKKVVENTLLETYDYVQKMPKEEREQAMAYVYDVLGLWW